MRRAAPMPSVGGTAEFLHGAGRGGLVDGRGKDAAQGDDFADDDQRGGMQRRCRHQVRKRGKGAVKDALPRSGTLLDDRDRGFGRTPVLDQRADRGCGRPSNPM